MRSTTLSAALALCLGGACFAQSAVDPAHNYSWQENGGWMNWSDGQTNGPWAPSGRGVFAAASYLTGMIWCENLGWVSVGLTPHDGHTYANGTSSDYGVNIDASGALSGFAWSETGGWINFTGGAMASPPNPARLDAASLRLRGFAWNENFGWINLDDAQSYVGFLCPADVDDGSGAGTPDGGVTIDDLVYYVGAFMDGTIRVDVDDGSGTGVPDGGVTIDDLLYYLQRFVNGC